MEGTHDTVSHDCLHQWNGKDHAKAGSSCRVLWHSKQAPWHGSQGCASEAINGELEFLQNNLSA